MTDLRVQPVLSDPSTMLVSSTVLVGVTGVVVVDAGFTRDHGTRIAEQVAATGLPLVAVIATHQHPDHHLGAAALLQPWPDARFVAAPEVVAGIAATGAAKLEEWRPALGNRLPDVVTLPEALDEGYLELDGKRIEVLSLGQGDCADNTAVHVPSVGAVITGDFAYSGTHVWLVETDAAARRAWRENLDRLAALAPETVVAGHIAPGASTGADVLSDTRDYLDAYEQERSVANSAEDLVARMVARRPDLALPLVLQLSAGAAFGGAHR